MIWIYFAGQDLYDEAPLAHMSDGWDLYDDDGTSLVFATQIITENVASTVDGLL